MSVYLRKPSNEAAEDKDKKDNRRSTSRSGGGHQEAGGQEDKDRKDKFLKDMARRSMDVPADFLDKIAVMFLPCS